MVGAVEKRWQEPDHGIWEVRRSPRHHVHSKVMCWVTVDRALRVAADFVDGEHHDWELLRDQIRDDILARGWKDDVGAFTAAYDGTDVDASVLAVGLYGLVDPSDDRFLGHRGRRRARAAGRRHRVPLPGRRRPARYRGRASTS